MLVESDSREHVNTILDEIEKKDFGCLGTYITSLKDKGCLILEIEEDESGEPVEIKCTDTFVVPDEVEI